MEVPVRLALAPGSTAATLAAILAGVALGTASGLTPGLHANTFALGLASLAAAVPGPPRLIGAAMLAAGTTHTFLDVVPALALGVPDPSMAAGALPGHRLVIAGRGREALRLSALGSGLAVAAAVPLAIPVTLAMGRAWPVLRAHLTLVMAAVAALLVLGERSPRAMVGAVLSLGASGALGLATLDLSPAAPLSVGGMLAPLFAGLFGAPVLIESIGGAGVPPQDDATVALPKRRVAVVALVGTACGAVVGYVPGVSAAVAAAGALAVLSGSGPRAYVVATSGVNTATAVFALFALVSLGTPRTGVLVALESSKAPLNLPVLLASVSLAASASFALVPVVGDRYLERIRRFDPTRLAVAVLCLLVVLSGLFAGGIGVGTFAAATAVGLVPARFGAKRANLMGVLVVPLAL
ncbi:tripartite tricarboxylate transporter permease [Halomicrobium salinisoli]|uniref:tripartite tricarboxylate transporter permease n=1 Tax=Halomicrobium salinisoli TaxID=2878391 RepID=UPI001CF0944C|nr:tripartite tricarboxylate transporter permease [Halomicrobium salinisoli]